MSQGEDTDPIVVIEDVTKTYFFAFATPEKYTVVGHRHYATREEAYQAAQKAYEKVTRE